MERADRVAAITGAASGIGRATALALSRGGHRVALCDRSATGLADVAKIIEGEGGRARAMELDVSDQGQAARAIDGMDVNAKGVFLGMKYAIPAMQKAGGGSIVNISSISGFVGQGYVHMAYNASKGAVRVMTKSAAFQFAKDGIRVNSVHPGVLPPMRTSKGAADPERRKKMVAAVPMKREGRVEEVAYAVLFLASDEASYITGTEVVVDGGFLAM